MTPEDQSEFLRAVAIYIREQVDLAVADRMREFRFVGPHEHDRKYQAAGRLFLHKAIRNLHAFVSPTELVEFDATNP